MSDKDLEYRSIVAIIVMLYVLGIHSCEKFGRDEAELLLVRYGR